LLYKRVTEQYRNLEILKIIRSLIPEDIVLQTKEEAILYLYSNGSKMTL